MNESEHFLCGAKLVSSGQPPNMCQKVSNKLLRERGDKKQFQSAIRSLSLYCNHCFLRQNATQNLKTSNFPLCGHSTLPEYIFSLNSWISIVHGHVSSKVKYIWFTCVSLRSWSLVVSQSKIRKLFTVSGLERCFSSCNWPVCLTWWEKYLTLNCSELMLIHSMSFQRKA